jgi:hypothetical protein
VVAKRVCTTDRSSAQGRAITCAASPAAGVAGSARITVAARPRMASSTSVVVPDRVIATTAS